MYANLIMPKNNNLPSSIIRQMQILHLFTFDLRAFTKVSIQRL